MPADKLQSGRKSLGIPRFVPPTQKLGRQRRGVTTVLLTLMFPVVLAVAAYSINLVYMELSRTELQIATDVATRAAGRALAVTGDTQKAIEAAERLMAANPFTNSSMSLSSSDIVFGVSTRLSEFERYQFSAGENPNAVQIQSNGKLQVPMLFPTMGVPIDFRPIKSSISTQTEMDIALVLDRSGSMAYAANEVSSGATPPAAAPPGWQFGNPAPPLSRWLDASEAIQRFLDVMSESKLDEHLSLSTYNERANVDVELTNQYGNIQQSIFQYTSQFKGGATNIGDGILAGVSTLSNQKTARPWATRVLIVLTDGIHNTGTDPLVAAQIAASQHIQIYTVTFSNEADIAKMEQVAAAGSGVHFHATTGTQLADAFREIAHSLPTLITY